MTGTFNHSQLIEIVGIDEALRIAYIQPAMTITKHIKTGCIVTVTILTNKKYSVTI